MTCDDYTNEAKVFSTFKTFANDITDPTIDEMIDSPSSYFVIRSKKFDDIHKAFKYGIWTSSGQNNEKFAKNIHSKNIFFLFTVIGADKFVGFARMVSDYSPEVEFPYWGELGKWKGLFKIKWLLFRDVPFSQLTNIVEFINKKGSHS